MINWREDILKPLTQTTMSFLGDELEIKPLSSNFNIGSDSNETSYICTSTITVGGGVNFTFAMSFEKNILQKLTKAFVYGKATKEELDEIQSSVANEIANTVLGNAIADFPDDGMGVDISPPSIVDYLQIINNNFGNIIINSQIKTPDGAIALTIINQTKERG